MYFYFIKEQLFRLPVSETGCYVVYLAANPRYFLIEKKGASKIFEFFIGNFGFFRRVETSVQNLFNSDNLQFFKFRNS